MHVIVFVPVKGSGRHMATNKLLADLAERLSMQTAIVLVRRYGGRTFRVPMPDTLHELHPLVLTIGLSPATVLCKEYGGIALNLPNEVNALIDVRNAEIVRLFLGPSGTGEDGESIRSIGFDFGLDRRYIQKIIDSAGHRNLRLSRSVTD